MFSFSACVFVARCATEHVGASIHCSKLEPLNERARMHWAGLAFARMSQNNTTSVYAGIDVAKATLDLNFAGARHSMNNDAKGHQKLLDILHQSQGPVHAIIESSGAR